MACYVCEYQLPVGVMPVVPGQPTTTPAKPRTEPVGACRKCGVLACPTHGVRPAITSVDDFRCAPCLGKVLTTAGLSGHAPADAEADDQGDDRVEVGVDGDGGDVVVPPALWSATRAIGERTDLDRVAWLTGRFREGDINPERFEAQLLSRLPPVGPDVDDELVRLKASATSGLLGPTSTVTIDDLDEIILMRAAVLRRSLEHEVRRLVPSEDDRPPEADVDIDGRSVWDVALGVGLVLAAHGITDATAELALARPETVPAVLSMPVLPLWTLLGLAERS
jgi:hypothetical protein